MGLCVCCLKKDGTIERPMITRVSFGKESAVKVCERCDKETDLYILQQCVPLRQWRRALRYLYGTTRVFLPKCRQNFYGVVCLNEIKPKHMSIKKFKPKKMTGTTVSSETAALLEKQGPGGGELKRI